MYVMHKQGIKGALWHITDKLNQNLQAVIKTSHGNTKPINIENSIRQGGVISVTQYATLMDEINKEMTKENEPGTHNTNNRKTCLLWVDDVALITSSIEDQRKLLHITNEVANRYRIVFAHEKSKVLKIGKKNRPEDLYLGNMKLEYTDKYKYLGEIINKTGQIDDHLKETERKIEGAYQTIL